MIHESLVLGKKYASGILNPSGMFNNSYRYVHIQSTKLIKILNEIVSMVAEFKEAMMNKYEITYLGLMKYFLEIQVCQCKREILISQEKYLENLPYRFYLKNCKPVSTLMRSCIQMIA